MRPTLGQVSLLSLLGLCVALAGVLYSFYRGSRETLLQSSRLLLVKTADQVDAMVAAHLRQAEGVVDRFQQKVEAGVVNPRDPLSLERALVGEVAGYPDLAEATFTYASLLDEEGMILDRNGRGQVSAYREGDRVLVRDVVPRGGRFVATVTERLPQRRMVGVEPAADPTDSPTFTTPARRQFRGQSLWSDLFGHPLDGRTVVTVQRAIEDGRRFAGVLRVGLHTDEVNRVADLKPGGPEDPHLLFLIDSAWRFVTPFGEDDPLVELEVGRRYQPAGLPPVVQAAREHLVLQEAERERFETLDADGVPWLVALRRLEGTQDWIVGIAVPESHYLGPLLDSQRTALLGAMGAVVLILVLGWSVLRAIHRDLGGLVAESNRMRGFEFAPAPPSSLFQDVGVVAQSLESTKTAMRTLSKYAPVELVRRLFRENREPHLGGDLREVTLIFTDVEGFSSLAERLPIDDLARRLAEYLEQMNAAVHGGGGTVLERVGDALLVSFNAPTDQPDHARLACGVALAMSRVATLRTRLGLHTDRVMVGHFGSPDRMNYGVMGDGVNLAARLESLNKQYGTTILASAATREQAGEGFGFRRLDCVAVKGRLQGIDVYELLDEEPGEVHRRYEEALALYLEGSFAEAGERFAELADDPPARVMAERCRRLASDPPEGWTGVYAAREK